MTVNPLARPRGSAGAGSAAGELGAAARRCPRSAGLVGVCANVMKICCESQLTTSCIAIVQNEV